MSLFLLYYLRPGPIRNWLRFFLPICVFLLLILLCLLCHSDESIKWWEYASQQRSNAILMDLCMCWRLHTCTFKCIWAVRFSSSLLRQTIFNYGFWSISSGIFKLKHPKLSIQTMPHSPKLQRSEGSDIYWCYHYSAWFSFNAAI